MREPFVHEARLVVDAGDPDAIGAAVTKRLCGQVDHPPPCPLAPHFTSIQPPEQPQENAKEVRVLFAALLQQEADVRREIAAALDSGQFGTTRWRLLGHQAGVPSQAEEEHARRIAGS